MTSLSGIQDSGRCRRFFSTPAGGELAEWTGEVFVPVEDVKNEGRDDVYASDWIQALLLAFLWVHNNGFRSFYLVCPRGFW